MNLRIYHMEYAIAYKRLLPAAAAAVTTTFAMGFRLGTHQRAQSTCIVTSLEKRNLLADGSFVRWGRTLSGRRLVSLFEIIRRTESPDEITSHCHVLCMPAPANVCNTR